MRAISLSLRAFGPYLESQTIHFDMLGQETIFLVTGPTGAGKTTIFDAICYALYGRASGSDREQDSLRSHFAAREDKTEVRFRFALQDREYEVIRTPRQLKEKERGEGFTEEPAKAVLYEIIPDDERKLISSRIKDVNDALEEKLGFDYDQFRKMILIPQGEFRKLISENSKEREAILQKIFRTYLYEKITEELKNEAKELKNQIAGIGTMMEQELYRLDWQHALPSEEDDIKSLVEKLKSEIEQTRLAVQIEAAKKGNLSKQLKEAQDKLHAGRMLEEKFTDQQRLLEEQERMNGSRMAIEDKQRRLKLAKDADTILPLESQSMTRKKEWEEQVHHLKAQEQRLAKLEAEFLQISQAHQKEQAQETEREALKDKIKEAKEQLELVSNYLLLKKETDQILKNKELLFKDREKLTIEIKSQQSSLESLEKQLENESSLTAAYYDSKSDLEKAKNDLSRLREIELENNKLLQFRKRYVDTQKAFKLAQDEAIQSRNKLDELEQEQQLQYAAMLAHSLEDGSPCPVCGSIEHPQKQMRKDSHKQTEDLASLKELVKRKDEQVAKLQQEFYECKSNGQSQRTIVENVRREIKDLLPEEELTAGAIAEAIARARQKESTLVSKHSQVERELREIQNLKSKKTAIKNKIDEFKQTFDQLSEKYQSVSDSAAGATVRLRDMEQRLPGNPEDAAAFKAKINQMETHYMEQMQKWETTQKNYQSAQEQLQKEKVILEQMQGYIEKAEETFRLHHRKYEEAVTATGFDSISSYHEAKLAQDEQQQIEQEITSFENRIQHISFRLKELQASIEGKERPDITRLTRASEEIQEQLQKASDLLYSLSQKEEHDTLISKRVGELLVKQKELEEEYYVIGELADLAHGNNQLKLSFERYVLSSFLDEILIQANLRLERMTNHRYQLIRSGQIAKRGAQSGLDLEVLDHHTGKQRSVKTLSGGEGFKASLSLALGLADVVQAHAGGVQLDTLFIDEGFGTLDEVSLQQAIDCLKDLQDSNRLLGIISHVPQLKNEIHAKLQIIPSPKGSRLEFSFS